MITRRGLLVGGSVGVAVGVGLGGVVGWEMAPTSVRADVRRPLRQLSPAEARAVERVASPVEAA